MAPDRVRCSSDMPSLPFLDPPIADGRVALRDAAERDIPEILIAHQDDPQLYARLGLERPPSAAELGRQIEEAPREHHSGTRARLTILEHPSDEFRGRILVHNVDPENAAAELGVWVVPRARGKGIARAALRLASGWLFENGFARLELLIEPDNQPMLRAATAAGFVHQDAPRGDVPPGESRQGMAILSLLASDSGASDASPPIRACRPSRREGRR